MKRAIIWGASGGIGRALVEELAAGDWQVVAVSRDPQKVDGLTPHNFAADVTDDYDVQNAVMCASYELDAVDLFVYAAGDITAAPVAEMDVAAWQRIMGANLTGAYLTTYRTLPLLAPDAHLVFLGAVSERLRLPGLSAYASAKAGLEAFADALRKEQRQRRITLVRPAAVDTPLWAKVPMRLPRDAAPPQKVAQQIIKAYEQGHKGTLDLV